MKTIESRRMPAKEGTPLLSLPAPSPMAGEGSRVHKQEGRERIRGVLVRDIGDAEHADRDKKDARSSTLRSVEAAEKLWVTSGRC